MKRKTHKLVVNVTFDKPISKADAAKLFADSVWGKFYPSALPGMVYEDTPGLFKIRSVKAQKTAD
jgi:hypothetical protein